MTSYLEYVFVNKSFYSELPKILIICCANQTKKKLFYNSFLRLQLNSEQTFRSNCIFVCFHKRNLGFESPPILKM